MIIKQTNIGPLFLLFKDDVVTFNDAKIIFIYSHFDKKDLRLHSFCGKFLAKLQTLSYQRISSNNVYGPFLFLIYLISTLSSFFFPKQNKDGLCLIVFVVLVGGGTEKNPTRKSDVYIGKTSRHYGGLGVKTDHVLPPVTNTDPGSKTGHIGSLPIHRPLTR